MLLHLKAAIYIFSANPGVMKVRPPLYVDPAALHHANHLFMWAMFSIDPRNITFPILALAAASRHNSAI